MKTRKTAGILWAAILTATLLLSACSAAPTQTPAPSVTQEITPAPETPSPTPSPTPTPTETPTPTPVPTPTPTPTPVVHEDGPNVIGIYMLKGSSQVLLTEYNEKWVRGKDICSPNLFHAVASNSPKVSASTGKAFLTAWDKFPNAKQFKVGYILSFTLKSGEVVTLTIRGPEDAPKDPKKYFYQYVEVYLYDAVHQKGRHSHLTKTNPDTYLTTIKLTAGSKIKDVESIRLTAFVYKDDGDFNPDTGEYIGAVSYAIPINNGSGE